MSGNEPLEAQLRLREDKIRELQTQLTDAEHSVATAQREAGLLRSKLEAPNSVPFHEQVAAGYAVEEIEIHRLLTGVTSDGKVHVVVRPIDKDGDLVKLPGALEFRLVNLSAENGNDGIGDWKFTAADSKELWTSAAIGAGYVVDLPADMIPADARLMLHARFVPSDGRQFDASHGLKTDSIVQASFEE